MSPTPTYQEPHSKSSGLLVALVAGGLIALVAANVYLYVQVDHLRPFAAGGDHDPSNLRLLCAAHNRRAAEKVFGSTHYRRE